MAVLPGKIRPSPCVLVLILLFLMPGNPARAQVDAAALLKAMQSIAVLTTETGEGQKMTGLAFLTGDGGRAVTAAHLVRNARKVTLRFRDGLEAVSAGIVELDEKRGIALIDAGEAGKEPLKISAGEIITGTAINFGAVRDNTWGILQLTVSEIRQGHDGVERYALSGEAPYGNSGSPALDNDACVTGVVIESPEGRILVPSAYITALNPALTARGWGVSQSIPGLREMTATLEDTEHTDETDLLLVDLFVTIFDHDSIYRWADLKTFGTGFLEGVPQEVYNYQARLEMTMRKLAVTRNGDPLRNRVTRIAREAGNSQVAGINYFIQAVVAGQETKDWGARSQNLQKRSNAALAMAGEILKSELPAIMELFYYSDTFRQNLPRECRFFLGIEKRPSMFEMGVLTLIKDPLYLLAVWPDSMATELDLRTGDRIIAAAGKDFDPEEDSIEDLKMILQENLGNTVDVLILREGYEITLRMKIPEEMPDKFLYPE